MNVVQSYLTTIMKGDFSLYEVRIFLKIVELANKLIAGQKISKLAGKAVCVDGYNCTLSMPVREIMTKNSQAYGRVRDALTNLMHKEVELMEPEKRQWHKATLLNNITVSQGDGMVKFVVPKWLLEYILNFINKNYSMYNLQAALSLPSAHMVRLYWLTCSMSSPVDYSISMLKDMLGCSDKYPNTKDFIKRCIDPAVKEFAVRKLNGFTYTKIKERNRITKLRFSPVRRQVQGVAGITAKAPLSVWVPLPLRQYLANQCGFSQHEMEANKALLFEFSHISGYEDKIIAIEERRRKKGKSKGYLIAAVKSEVAEWERRNG